MMNQNYGFTERGGRFGHDRMTERGYDRSPYRRPFGRGGMPDRGAFPYGMPNTPRAGSCGCGLNRGESHPYSQNNGYEHRHDIKDHNYGNEYGRGQEHAHDQNRSLHTMKQSGCGCGSNPNNGNGNGNHNGACGNHSSCNRLMDQIRAVDFALYETVLYLDVYPNSCDALETYHKLKSQREALRKEYEASCGPLTAFGNQSTASWDWMSKPCPWEYDAD